MRDISDILTTIAVIAFFVLALFSCSYIGDKRAEADEKRYQEAYEEGYNAGYEAGEESKWSE